MNERIQLTDTTQDVVVKLSDGNPGCMNVCVKILRDSAKIDPQSAGPLFTLLTFDTLGIYGSRVWMLYKDVCKENLTDTLGVMRGFQLGIITAPQLNHAIDNYGDGLDVKDVVTQVRERLSEFACNS